MALSRRNVALWVFSATCSAACGEAFTGSNGSDAGDASAGTTSSGGATGGGNAGRTGGSAGRGGRAGSAGAVGAGSGGAAGTLGTGSEGASGAAGVGGSGGSGGVDGASGDGPGGASGSNGLGSGGSAGSATGGINGSAGLGSGGSAGAASGGSGGSVVACPGGEPRCTDGQCARVSWNFDSLTPEGAKSVSGHAISVELFDDHAAFALNVPELNTGTATFSLPICTSGTANLRSRTLSFRFFFEGSPPTNEELIIQAGIAGSPPSYFGTVGDFPTGGWVSLSAPFSQVAASSATQTLLIQAASTGTSFSGKVWFDDIVIR